MFSETVGYATLKIAINLCHDVQSSSVKLNLSVLTK